MSETPYGFDAAKLRAARSAAGASVPRIARQARVSERAVSLYLAGSRVPRPEVLPRLAAAVGVGPADLCTVEHERLVHLRVWAGRSRATMAEALGMAEETYRLLETTGRLGRAAARFQHRLDCWVLWKDWAAPVYGVTPERLAAATAASQAYWPVLRAERFRRIREYDPEFADRLEQMLGEEP
ncbi:helix-turn-helix domain-containing protein [Streptomyces sp. NPDC015125]|uniref:helix-turn-helix domain-containing protein n=1 Tax=Streptomyces sp. NPDC015125 TaxID=3364938 RepID=UPI0036FB8B89